MAHTNQTMGTQQIKLSQVYVWWIRFKLHKICTPNTTHQNTNIIWLRGGRHAFRRMKVALESRGLLLCHKRQSKCKSVTKKVCKDNKRHNKSQIPHGTLNFGFKTIYGYRRHKVYYAVAYAVTMDLQRNVNQIKLWHYNYDPYFLQDSFRKLWEDAVACNSLHITLLTVLKVMLDGYEQNTLHDISREFLKLCVEAGALPYQDHQEDCDT